MATKICDTCGERIDFDAKRHGSTGECPRCGELLRFSDPLPRPHKKTQQSAPSEVKIFLFGCSTVVLLGFLSCAGLIMWGADIERRQNAGKTAIERQFSNWDGSHPAVVSAVKSAMHNPNSFDHVKTQFRETDSQLVVYMTYRGTNAFGAVVTNQVIARLTKSGQLVSIDAN